MMTFPFSRPLIQATYPLLIFLKVADLHSRAWLKNYKQKKGIVGDIFTEQGVQIPLVHFKRFSTIPVIQEIEPFAFSEDFVSVIIRKKLITSRSIKITSFI